MGRWRACFLVLGAATAIGLGPRRAATPAGRLRQDPSRPLGVLHDLPVWALDSSWTIHYHKPFSNPMTMGDIFPGHGECLLWATQSSPDADTYHLAAVGERAKIEKELNMDHMGHDVSTVSESGVYWYVGRLSDWLFAGVAELPQIDGTPNFGDMACLDDCDSRISWIINASFGGYFRSGDQGYSDGVPIPLSNEWLKVVAYGPCNLFEPPEHPMTELPRFEHPEPTTTARPKTASKTRGHGDPHMTNVRGENFDVFRTGRVVLLESPGTAAGNATADFRLVANILPMRNITCSPIFIGLLEVSGSSLGGASIQVTPENHEHRPVVTAGNQTGQRTFGNLSLSYPERHLLAMTVRTALSTAEIKVWQHSKPKYDFFYFDVSASGLGAFGGGVGGILGYGSHAGISRRRPECYNRREANAEQLLISRAYVQ